MINLPVIDNQCSKFALDIVEHENHCLVYHTSILIVIMNMLMSLLWFKYNIAQLKSMLKGVGATFPGDWNQLLPWKSFAYHEVQVEGLYFSPVDLVFERNKQGVLQSLMNSSLKDNIPDKRRSQNVIDYVLQLRERIRSSLDIVNENDQVTKKRSKFWYDRNAKAVSYKEGVLVLVLLPLIGKPFQAQFFGPYAIEKRIGEVDYVVRTPRQT